MIKNIDNWLLERVEKFCHWFQVWTGKDNFWLAIVSCCCLFAFGLISYYLTHWLPDKDSKEVVYGSFAMLAVASFARWFYYKYRYPRQRNDFFFWDCRSFLVSLMFITFIATALFFILTLTISLVVYCFIIVSYFYFLSCTPLPPCEGRIREWINSRVASETA